MKINQEFTFREFTKNKKILISDLEKLSAQKLFELTVENNSLIINTLNKSLNKNFLFFFEDKKSNFHLLINKIEFLNFIILFSAIFFTLTKRNLVTYIHYKIFEDILKCETLYHLEINNADKDFFKNFIINRVQTYENIKLSNFATFVKSNFYTFSGEIENMSNNKVNNLLDMLINTKLQIQKINFN